MRVWLWLVYKFTKNYVACDFSPSSFKLRRGILPLLKKYMSNLSSTCHIKLKCFLWTKLLENLLLAKYLTPVTKPLRNRTYLGKKLFFNFSGANFLTLKNSHQCEKQPVLGPDCWIWANKCLQGLKTVVLDNIFVFSICKKHIVYILYSINRRLQKDKFSQQHCKKISRTVMDHYCTMEIFFKNWEKIKTNIP